MQVIKILPDLRCWMLSTSPQRVLIESPSLMGLSLERVKEGDKLVMCNLRTSVGRLVMKEGVFIIDGGRIE